MKTAILVLLFALLFALAGNAMGQNVDSIGSYDTPGQAYGVFVSGNYAYVANGAEGLLIVNVSDPGNPSLAGSYNTPGSANGVFVSGDYVYVADENSLMILRFTATGVQEDESVPLSFSLGQNYPNPFNAQTKISYSLPKASNARLDIFNLLGQKIETLFEGHQQAGEHSVAWDASGFSSGIYFYKLVAGDKVFTKRMTVVK